MPPRFARTAAVSVLAGLACAGAAEPAPESSPRPLLEQLNRETQLACRDVRRGVLRVQLPPPRWTNEVARDDSPLTKYKDLDPKVREQLEQRRSAPVSTTAASVDATSAVIVVPPPAAPLTLYATAGPTTRPFEPNNVALVLDEKGHLLVPLFLERDAVGGAPLPVTDSDGNHFDADFVGSDRQTNLTVLKLNTPAGTPVQMDGQDRPAEGSLALLFTPLDGAARLQLWTAANRDYGVVFTVGGDCAGVARFGRFLSGRACRLIAEQIIRHGSVPRATLGAIITEIARTDPSRREMPALGSRPAVRVDQVMPGSAAEKAGLEVGDVLLALAGQSVGDIPALAAAIAARDGPTEFRVLRGGRELSVEVDLRRKE